MLPKNISKHEMKTRKTRKFKVNFARTKLYKNSSIPYIANLLNKDDGEKSIVRIMN